MGMDRLEILPSNIGCPACGSQLDVHRGNSISKRPKGKEFADQADEDMTYLVDCKNSRCPDYRKVKFLKARYVEVEFKWVD